MARRLFASYMTVVFILGMAMISLAHAQQLVTPDSREAAALIEHVRKAGQTAVIVHLNVQTQADMNSPDSIREAQRSEIASKQASLLSRLSPNVKTIERFSDIPFIVMNVDGASLEAILASPEVKAVEATMRLKPDLETSAQLVGATGAWVRGFEGHGWKIAILDTGVDTTHPFFQNKVVAEWCFSGADPDSVTLCPNGENHQAGIGAGTNCALAGCDHGTGVAGVAAGFNGTFPSDLGPPVHFSGIARGASIFSIQVFSQFIDSPSDPSKQPCFENQLSSPCVLASSADILRALASLNSIPSIPEPYKIAAINMSLGSGRCNGDSCTYGMDSFRCSETAVANVIGLLRLDVDNANGHRPGILTVAATGNNGYTNAIKFPACAAIGVGGSTKSNTIWSFSNASDSMWLFAPALQIRSSLPGGTYQHQTGTSMAAAHVAGAIAIMRAAAPAWVTTDQLLSFLTRTRTIVHDTRPDGAVAKPRIDVDFALTELLDWAHGRDARVE